MPDIGSIIYFALFGVVASVGGIIWGISDGETGDSTLITSVVCLIACTWMAWHVYKNPKEFGPRD